MTLTALGMPALRSRTNGIADPRVVPPLALWWTRSAGSPTICGCR